VGNLFPENAGGVRIKTLKGSEKCTLPLAERQRVYHRIMNSESHWGKKRGGHFLHKGKWVEGHSSQTKKSGGVGHILKKKENHTRILFIYF